MSERELEKILKAMAKRRRIAVLKFIKKSGRASVGEIADAIKLSFTATSKHLAILSNAGILDKEQESLTVFYFLAQEQHVVVSKLLSII